MSAKEVIAEIEQYQKAVLQLNTSKVIENIDNSFIQAKTPKHYVGLIPIDIEDYYAEDELSELMNNGFYRDGNEKRYYNCIFVPKQFVEDYVQAINESGYAVDKIKAPNGNDNYIVTLNGLSNSHLADDQKFS